MSPRHTRAFRFLSVSVVRCTPLQRMTAAFTRRPNSTRTTTQNRSILEWSPLKCVAFFFFFFFFLPPKRDERTFVFFGDFFSSVSSRLKQYQFMTDGPRSARAPPFDGGAPLISAGWKKPETTQYELVTGTVQPSWVVLVVLRCPAGRPALPFLKTSAPLASALHVGVCMRRSL